MRRAKQSFSLLVFLMMIWPPLSFAGTVNLPRTGQTTPYETGDDGDLQKGVAWPSPRFTANVDNNGDGDCTDPRETCDGTVTDNLTGLVWLKNANCGGANNWNDALAYCNTLANGSCGLTDGSVAGDWHLPNIAELESLINAEESSPATWLNNQGFSSVQSPNYWSATTIASFTDYAWSVDMYYGYRNVGNKFSYYYVWPVRAGQ